MDLNDPRRRLQVLNNASPSIRIASQPQQKLTVAKAPTQPQPQISIAQPKQYNIAVPKAPAPDPNVPNYSNKFKGLTSEGTETKKLFGWDVGKYMGDFGKITKLSAGRDYESNADDFIKSYDNLNDAERRIYVNDVIKKAKNGDQVALNTAKVLNDKGKLGGTFSDFLEAANNKAFGWTRNASNFNKQKDVQERLDNFTAGQIGKELDPITVGTDIGLTIAGGAGAAKLVSKIPVAQRIIQAGGFGAKAIPFLADSLGGGLTQEAISQARGRETSFAQDMATGTAIDVGANLLFKGAGKFMNLFRQGKKSASVVDDIIKESDPSKIQQVMKVDNNLANYLAQETNPDAVREVLKTMELDPNIQLPDEVRKRLEEEGISAVRKGYTQTDINSEDFSDYMQKALTGRIKEVPEELRPVIAKYAKTAANEAEDLGIAGAKAVDAPTTDFKTKVNSKVNQELFDEGLVSGKIFEKNINDLKLGPNTDPTEAPDVNGKAMSIEPKNLDSMRQQVRDLWAAGKRDEAKKLSDEITTLMDIEYKKNYPKRGKDEAFLKSVGENGYPEKVNIGELRQQKNGVYAEDRYPNEVYQQLPNFIAKNDIPGTSIKSGDKVGLAGKEDGLLEAVLMPGKEYQQEGFTVSREPNMSIKDFRRITDGSKPTLQTALAGKGMSIDDPTTALKQEALSPEAMKVYVAAKNMPDAQVTDTLRGLTGYENTPAHQALQRIANERKLGGIETSHMVVGSKEWSDAQAKLAAQREAASAPTPKAATMQEGRTNKALDGQIRYNGTVMDKRQYIDALVKDGYAPQVKKINGKDRYVMEHSTRKGDYYVVTKTEHDLAKSTAAPKVEAPTGAPIEKTPQAVAPDGSVKTTSPEDAGTTFSTKNEYYHGSTNDKLTELDTGANLGLNEKRNLVYLSDTEKGAAPYMKNRAADGSLSDSPTGKMYKVSLDGKVVDATDSNAITSLKTLPGYESLDSLTKRHINNAESLNYLDPDILENNPDLVKFLSENGIKGVRTALPNSPGDTQVIALDKGATKLLNGEKTTPTAEEIVPNADDETKRAVQEVLDSLNSAQKGYDDAAKIRTQQKAARISKADGAFEAAGGGEAGVRAKLGALKGKYAESGFNPITASEGTQNTILNDIESSSLRSFEKLNLQNAMRKIWGATDGKPTPGEINMIRKYFGEDGDQMAKAIEDAVAEDPKTWRDRIVDIAGVPRAAMASFDFSMGLRQGGQVAVRNFPDWVNANKESIKYVKNADYFKSEMKRIADDDAFETITDKLGVRLPAVTGNSDEMMASAHILEKIPVYGKGIEASDRAYSGGLTKLRYNIAKKWIDSLGGPDQALKDLSEKELRDIGEVINTSTGSGGKKGGFTEKNMQTLAATLFAPRLWASRLNAINPAYYARLSPIARRRAIENIASFMAAAGVVVGLADAAGAEVEMDPRSSDFMKIKVGNTRFDIFGGLQQNVVFFARMVTGEKKNSSTGEIQTMGEGFGQPNRLDLAQDMLQNKLNPLLGYAARMLQSSEGDTGNPNDRKDKFGEDLNVAQETGKLVVPLGIQGLADTYNDTGDVGKSLAMNVPNFFGIGTQTYGETPTKDQKTDSNGKIAFGGKIQDNMVLDSEGNVFMDEKNRPVKVKFDKDASEAEKKAALKKAQNEAYTKKAKSLLSQEDADLYATGQADPNSLDQAQKDKFDQIKKWVSDYGKSVDVPKSVKSDAAKTFYQKYNTMTKKDQEAWLKEAPDENAKTVAAELNKQRVKGLPEYKPSNYLSKEYAEYEKDLLEHPEYTNIDKQNKARAFQTKAYKYNYSEDQRDIFNEGGSSDLKSLIDDGQVSKEDLDAAIKLDEELYNSGLTGSLKFSKKFRNNYGYGTPAGKGGSGGSGAGRGGSGSGGSGGGSGSGESKRAYLSAYVSNGTEGAKKEAPQFSSKRRTTGISFKDVSTPKKSNSKKVTINL